MVGKRVEANLPIAFLKCNRCQSPESFPRNLEMTIGDRVLPHIQISPLSHQTLLFAGPQKEVPITSSGWAGVGVPYNRAPATLLVIAGGLDTGIRQEECSDVADG